MKLDHLLCQFLYQQKKLSLPGIGTFTADASFNYQQDEKNKQPIQGIHFDNKADQQFSEELIAYLQAQTGKMRSLTISDLESYVMLNKQFLNIGKPLYLEGIGTLVKTKEGLFDFTPGERLTDRVEDFRSEARPLTEFEQTYSNTSQSGSSRGLVIGLITVITLGLIGWGAWFLFQHSSQKETQPETSAITIDTLATPVNLDTATKAYQPDSGIVSGIDSAVAVASQPPVTDSTSLKFIIEETNSKARALKRFNQLKELGKNIRMDTRDSSSFKLYFLLSVKPTDTTRIKDSLRIFYNSRIRIEK
ncbi:hypothetical protein KJS94_06960 [Flavihumibacter rivuli]|uniref:hypothetical protein n=1 Tax=Flavihumibacter rivuli TaxID=2838156 RepID=UPI001BDE2B21|nr:hypothetical protein [Flavihumibacter rivuli]ULQ57938.1 hypothetical protein KJS94_06960 [Flavihumibacter rivuli]